MIPIPAPRPDPQSEPTFSATSWPRWEAPSRTEGNAQEHFAQPDGALSPPQSILTIRGLIILLFGFYLVLGPVSNESDIVGAVIGFSLFATIVAVLVGTLVGGIRVRRSFRIIAAQVAGTLPESLSPGAMGMTEELGRVYAHHPALLTLQINPCKLLPLFTLTLQLEFLYRGTRAAAHVLSGTSASGKTLRETLVLPHRGRWVVRRFKLAFGDQLGLTSFYWFAPPPVTLPEIQVFPAPRSADQLPLLSSCERAGDAMAQQTERRGDPYELRQYNPADGMRRIVWKLFAKSGKLVSRHPEPSMTPEGHAVLFVAAGRYDDALCGLAGDYVRRLNEAEIEVLVGCEGMGALRVARTQERAYKLFLDTVWNLPHARGDPSVSQDVEHTLRESQSALADGTVDKLLVFVARERFTDRGAVDSFVEVGEKAQRSGARPLFVLLEGPRTLEGVRTLERSEAWRPGNRGTGLLHARILDLLVQAQNQPPQSRDTLVWERAFLRTCAAQNWEVIIAQ